MTRRAPGRLLFAGLLLWVGVTVLGLLPPVWAQSAPEPDASPIQAFSLSIQSPEATLSALLERHLELQRYKTLNDLDEGELQRLLLAADVQARELLATQGHFAPRLHWQSVVSPDAHTRWQVRLELEPGPIARIEEVQWTFQGDIQNRDTHAAQREAIRQQWRLPVGRAFTQDSWSEAKAAALRQLTTEHYPLGRWVSTEAVVDTEQHRVVLALALDSGPEVFIGPAHVSGEERYGQEQAQRLAHLPAGRSYRESDLLEAQQRLVLSGFYDAVFVSLDTEGPPEAMPVRIELKETPRQRWQFGVGVRSDTGPRLTLEHTHHRVPALEWRAITRLSVDRLLQSASLDLLSPPNTQLWRWIVSGRVEHQTLEDYEVRSERLRTGRTQLGERIDRSYYAQYDNAQTTGSIVDTRNALSAHYAWTWRNFDSLPFPSRGWGLGLELGAGLTLGESRIPYTRGLTKVLWMLPLGNQGHRLSLRGEAGAVATSNGDNIPVTQLFVAGGDRSVRGYAPGSIGITDSLGRVSPGRHLLTGSAEWLVPIRQGGRRSDWDGVLFIDAGRVSNQLSEGPVLIGAGVGARWRSPVGPLEIDLARALETGDWRLHMSIGFRF